MKPIYIYLIYPAIVVTIPTVIIAMIYTAVQLEKISRIEESIETHNDELISQIAKYNEKLSFVEAQLLSLMYNTGNPPNNETLKAFTSSIIKIDGKDYILKRKTGQISP